MDKKFYFVAGSIIGDNGKSININAVIRRDPIAWQVDMRKHGSPCMKTLIIRWWKEITVEQFNAFEGETKYDSDILDKGKW